MKIKDSYDLRDEILTVLNTVYAPEFEAKDWWWCKYRAEDNFTVQLNLQLVTDILATFAFAHIDPENDVRQNYYGETMFNRIHQIIWNNHPGGTTASYATELVAAILNVEVTG